MRLRAALLIGVALGLMIARPARSAAGFTVDARHVALFEQIPLEYVTAARDLRVLFSDRSVGQNINEGLDCLASASWGQAPSACRRDYYDAVWNWKTWSPADRDAGLVPARILFDPDPVGYSRANWTFEFRSGGWSELTGDFIQSLAPAYLQSKDVLSYQFSYLNVAATDDIADPARGFFADVADRYDVYDLEAFIAQHPDKVFVFWTTSLARGIGTSVSDTFNLRMREYCRTNDRVLFDVADILSRDATGQVCRDNRDGVPYTSMTGAFENHPDDGVDYVAICQDYTTEIDGGHLGSVSAGKIRVAKAMWVLMARVGGWNPFPADFDGDDDVDAGDFERFIACATGPEIPYDPHDPPADCIVGLTPAGWLAADLDEDGDVDAGDFARFQRCISGPDALPALGCAE